MTPHHTKISYNVNQDAEEFLKTPEGAKMLKTHQVEKEEQDENEEAAVWNCRKQLTANLRQ